MLSVNRDDISTRLGKVIHILFRLNNHQVHIQRLLGVGANGIHNQGTNGDVRHEATIHNINVNPVSACFINSLDFFSQATKIR